MAYQNFTIIDGLLSIAAHYLDPRMSNLLIKSGITKEQINKGGPLITTSSAKAILNDFICGRNQNCTYDLFPQAVFALKQFTLALNDYSLKNVVSYFLIHPNIDTAQNAIDAFSKYEAEHCLKKLS